jgi:hypothetical protein
MAKTSSNMHQSNNKVLKPKKVIFKASIKTICKKERNPKVAKMLSKSGSLSWSQSERNIYGSATLRFTTVTYSYDF